MGLDMYAYRTKEFVDDDNTQIKDEKEIAYWRKLTFKIQYELDNLPNEIDNIKEDLIMLEKILSDPKLFEEDQNRFFQTSEKIGDLQLLLEKKEDRWLELLEMENQ